MTVVPSFLPPTESAARECALWIEFDSTFPTEESCLRELYTRLHISERCRHCNSVNVREKIRVRTVNCANCHKDTWLTAGTFIDHIRKPRAWWAAIWLLERRIAINAYRLHKLTKVAYSTAFGILKKIMMLFEAQIPSETRTVASGSFASLYCRRSRETPARLHPEAEQHEAELRDGQSHSHSSTFSSPNPDVEQSESRTPTKEKPANSSVHDSKFTTADGMDERQQIVLGFLSEKPIHIDVLCQRAGFSSAEVSSILTILELLGIARSEPGARFVRSNPSQSASPMPSSSQGAATSPVIIFLKGLFGGISRKYLQQYIALYWYFHAQEHWTAEALYSAISFSNAINHSDLGYYVSPLMVAVPACPRMCLVERVSMHS